MRYFVYDPDDGIEFFETEAEARAEAVCRLADHRECASGAGDGWHDDIESLCWGKVIGQATLTKCEPAPNGPGDEYHEYEMKGTEP